MDDFYARAHELSERGEPFATATVVRSERPTSGKPGDKAIVTADGAMHGWIGGSCAQPAIVAEALAALADGRPRLVRITPEPGEDPPEGVEEVAMTCFSGGTLEIYVEPQEPRPRLLVVGHQPVAQALMRLGQAMGFRVLALALEDRDAVAGADEVLDDVDAIAARADRRTWIVVASHGHYDEPALERALSTPAPYVALVSSRKRARPILEHLRRQGLGDDALARLKVPAGLDIGARRGDEIALSIVAEIVQERRRAEAEAPAPATEPAEPAAETATARDPVCGMTVAVAGAAHTHEHAGTVYYFCCGGCQARFAAEPESFLAA